MGAEERSRPPLLFRFDDTKEVVGMTQPSSDVLSERLISLRSYVDGVEQRVKRIEDRLNTLILLAVSNMAGIAVAILLLLAQKVFS